MPYRFLRAAMVQLIGECRDMAEVVGVVDRLIELGVRAPVLTLTDAADLDLIPNGSGVVVGDLRQAPRVGVKCDHSILFVGEDEPYPFYLEGLAPPLPCTVVWLPTEGRQGFAALYARHQSERFGIPARQLLHEYSEDDQ